jgi:lysozyme
LLTDKVNENRFSALVSFAYNVGIGALSGSTLLKMINVSPGSPGILDEFMRWNKAKDPKTKKLRELTGLTNRRRAEADLYFSVG